MSKDMDKVVKWVAGAAVNGLAAVLETICQREFDLTPAEQAEMVKLINMDALHKHVAKMSAVEDRQDINPYYTDIEPAIAAASWTDLKRVIHALNMRLMQLTPEQAEHLKHIVWSDIIDAELAPLFATDKQHFTHASA